MNLQDPVYSFDGNLLLIRDEELGISIEQRCAEDEPSLKRVFLRKDEDLIQSDEWPLHGWVAVYRMPSSIEESHEEDPQHALSEELFLNGKRHGPTRTFYEASSSPSIITEAWYIDGLLHGRMRNWSRCGKKISEIAFSQGRRSGPTRIWSDTGVLISIQNYKDGEPHGIFQTFNQQTGHLARQVEYVHGKRHGADFLYHGEDGYLLFCDEWKNGEKKKVILDDLLEKSLHASIEQSKQQGNKKKSS